jgi:hypothetical protein
MQVEEALETRRPLSSSDFTLDVANRAAPPHHFALGAQASFPNGAKEIYLQLDGGEGFAGASVLAKAMPIAASAMSQRMPT